MNIAKELEKILSEHKCCAYKYDANHNKIVYICENNNCSTINSIVVQITGFLLLNNIDYFMLANKDIIINSQLKSKNKS